MTCAGCRFEAPPDFAFGPRCGARFAVAPPLLPRRPAATAADPEDVRGFQGDFFGEMARAVERYKGFVEKFVGDAVMAMFGAPVAHEDDPERGLRAALAMQERMGELNRRWARRLGRSLALHVGLDTGPVGRS